MSWKARCLLLLCVGIIWPSLTMAAADKLHIVGIEPGDSVVVIWRGLMSTGCRQTYEVLRSTGETELPNLLPSDRDCPSEIAIFSEKHSMVYESVTVWTSEPGDVHNVTLKPLITVPVTVWTLNSEEERRARLDMETATKLFLSNRVGIRFEPTYKNVSRDAVNSLVDRQCQAVPEIQGSAFYTRGMLNVYYLDSTAIPSRNCAIVETPPKEICEGPDMPGAADGNITYISMKRMNMATLTHELGHAFGLRPALCGGHTNWKETLQLKGLFGPDNIMWAEGGEERVNFTLGQVFRMNTHKDQWGGTMLINNGLRSGPGRPCPPLAPDATCPALNTPWP
jgi:hypothetical protein